MISDRVREMVEEGAAYPLARSAKDEELVKLCSNENPYGPSPKAVEAIREELEELGRYPESFPIELKEAIGDRLGVSSSQVCVGNGSDEIMDLACKAFMNPGEGALIPIPSFSWYELTCRINAMEPKFVELQDFRWSSDDLVDEMGDASLTFIGRPNNPTGNSIEEEGLKELLDTGKTVVVDEAYADFSDYSVVSWIEDYDNLVVLRTFSKLFGLGGLRIGYGLGNAELVMALERVRPPFSVNHLAQTAAIAALEDEEFLEESREAILEGRDYLEEELENLGFEVLPSDANFLMASPRPLGWDAAEICDYLAEEGILIRNLSGFRGVGPDWVRITVGRPEDNELLIEALRKRIEGRK